MKLIKFFVMLYLSLNTSFSYATTIDELGKTTVFLREQIINSEIIGDKKYEIWLKDIETQKLQPQLVNKISGTGFLISYNNRIYLVTAAHIAKNLSNKSEVIWNTASGISSKFTFEELQKGIPYSKWFFHPSEDIAIHPFGFSEKSEHILVPNEMFETKDEVIPLGTKVYILGFPLNLGIHDILSPISKKAEIASWITTIDNPGIKPTSKFILLDEALAQGFSGAPVFVSPEPQMINNGLTIGTPIKLIGIQSMAISDKTGGKISLVVPIFCLNDIFTSNDFKEYEQTIGIK